MNQKDGKVLTYLKEFLNHDNILFKMKSIKLCHNLNIPLSLGKMLEFYSSFTKSEKLKNIVMYIGETGNGKTTIINYLTGTEYEKLDGNINDNFLIPKNVSSNRLLKTSDTESIGYSETLYAEVLPSDANSNEIFFVDLPGFRDKREESDQSVVAELSLPIILNNTEMLKAIVIVMNFGIMFKRNPAERLERIKNLCEYLPQIFNNFEETIKKVNILFAITVSEDQERKKQDSTLLKSMETQLGDLEKMENKKYANEMIIREKSKNDCENIITIYSRLIELLFENKSKENIKGEIRTLQQDYNNLDFEITLERPFKKDCDDLINAKSDMEKDYIIQTWKQHIKNIKNKQDNDIKFLQDKKSITSMVNFICNAIKDKKVFIFRVVNDNAKDEFINTVKNLPSVKNEKELFKFNLEKNELLKNLNEFSERELVKGRKLYEKSKEEDKKILKYSEELKLLQERLLQNEIDLDSCLTNESIYSGNNDLIEIYEKQKDFYNKSIALIDEEIIKNEVSILRINETNHLIHSEKRTFSWKFFNMAWISEYPFNGIKSYFSRDYKLIKIQTVIFFFRDANTDKEHEIAFNQGVEEREMLKEITKIGKLKVKESNFNKGIFKFQFDANYIFKGDVGVKFYVACCDVENFANEIEEHELLIKELEISKKIEEENVEEIDDQIDEEKKLLREESQASINKINKINKRLSNLSYDTNKFINYLLKRDTLKNIHFDDILKIFSNVDEYRNDEILLNILKELGLSFENIDSILKNLREPKVFRKVSLEGRCKQFLKMINGYRYTFKEIKKHIEKFEEHSLKTIQYINNIISSDIEQKESYINFFKIRDWIKKENILEKIHEELLHEEHEEQINLDDLEEDNADYEDDVEIELSNVNLNINKTVNNSLIDDFNFQKLLEIKNGSKKKESKRRLCFTNLITVDYEVN
jgi:hypothetical protein